MKFFSIIILFICSQPYLGYAQDPLILEQTDQRFNHESQLWEDQSKTIFSYDHNGNCITKARYNLQPCDISDPNEYCINYELFSHKIENWRYNKYDLETRYSEQNYEYVWSEDPGYELKETNYLSRVTDYEKDSLIKSQIITQKYDLDDLDDTYRNVSIRSTLNKYDSENRPLYYEFEEAYYFKEELENLNINRIYYAYTDGLLVSKIENERSYYQEDTMEYRDVSTQFSYNQLGFLIEEVATYSTKYNWAEESSSTSRILYIYIDEKLAERRTSYWEEAAQNWIEYSMTSYDYHPGGLKKQEIRKTRDGNQFRIFTVEYDEKEREIYSSSEIQDENGNIIETGSWRTTSYFAGNEEGNEVKSYDKNGVLQYSWLNYTEYNSDKKPLNKLFYWWEYEADTLKYTSADEKQYDYDTKGFLVRTEEDHFIFSPDSILLIGCCGGFYNRETIYDNRCDGAPLIATIEESRFMGGTNFELFPETYLTRHLYKYSTALCDFGESELTALKVYPNPSNDKITVDSKLLQTYGTRLDLIDLNGKTMLSEMPQISASFQMDLSTLASGVYVLKLSNEWGSAEQKVVYYR